MNEQHGEFDASKIRLAIVAAKFSRDIVDRLLGGALQAIADAGGDPDTVPVARVPGSMELAVAAKKFAESGYDAVICLGCIIRGETSHYDAVVEGATRGLTDVATQTGVPILFGVLTCENREQALARSDESQKKNLGVYAACAAIEMANLMKKI